MCGVEEKVSAHLTKEAEKVKTACPEISSVGSAAPTSPAAADVAVTPVCRAAGLGGSVCHAELCVDELAQPWGHPSPSLTPGGGN